LLARPAYPVFVGFVQLLDDGELQFDGQ
jgi:hypothetical protein